MGPDNDWRVLVDGRVFYAGFNDSTVGAVTTNGDLTSFPASPFPLAVALGPDKQVWVGYFLPTKIGTMPTDGFATYHVYIGAKIQDLAAGPTAPCTSPGG